MKLGSDRIRRAFAAMAVIVLLVFGLLTLLAAIEARSPLARLTDRLVRSGRFAELGFDWSQSWALAALEDAPWVGEVSGAVPVGSVDPTQGILVINLWASWCPPCRAEMPSMMKLARTLEGQAQFVFVTYDEDWEAPKAMFREVLGGMPRGVVNTRDPVAKEAGEEQSPDSMWMRLGATALPETFFVRDGRVLAKVIGQIDWQHPDIEEWLRLVAR